MQVSFTEALALLPNATFIYSNVTDKELSEVSVTKYSTMVENVRIIGTLEPIPALESKELVAGSMSF